MGCVHSTFWVPLFSPKGTLPCRPTKKTEGKKQGIKNELAHY